MIPYGKQTLEDDDIAAVEKVLRSDWLTTGPEIAAFENDLARYCGAEHAVAICNGTAALHCAVAACDIGPGDDVIVSPMTFAASANAVVFQGGTPVFADVDPETLLIDPVSVEAKITPKTKAVIAVDYAGQPCDYVALRKITAKHGLKLIADACHSIGATQGETRAGALADLSCFSFHPVKPLTTAEGGAITTDDAEAAARMRRFRAHGVTADFKDRQQSGTWFYEMVELGYNYRITDIQCALGRNQLNKLDGWIAKRNAIAQRYDAAFSEIPGIRPLARREDSTHGFHLYVIRVDEQSFGMDRRALFEALRAKKIGVNVHYIPVHLHPFYRERFGTRRGQHPNAEAAYEQILSLPVFPALSDSDVRRVIEAVSEEARDRVG